MSEQFSILIDSRTRFETSEPGGVWLSMPTTKEQLHEAMQRVGILRITRRTSYQRFYEHRAAAFDRAASRYPERGA